ncbi:MAG: outer membrane beta-barrel protein [Gammaproteobacteria bacterium]
MLKTLARGAALLALAPLGAAADEPFSFIDLRLVGTADGGGFTEDLGPDGSLAGRVDDGLGWGLRGAWEFAPRWHLYGEWGVSNTTLKAELREPGGSRLASGESDFDMTRYALGVGYAWPVGQDWQVYGRVTYDFIEYGDFDAFELDGLGTVNLDDEDDSGVGATAGARWFGERWELDGWLRYTSVGELAQDGDSVGFDNDLGGGVRGLFHVTDRWSLGADYELADIDTWSAFVRFSL